METPTITSTAYTSSTTSAGEFANSVWVGDSAVSPGAGTALDVAWHPSPPRALHAANFPIAKHHKKEEPMGARIVKVFIADPTEDLPLESRVLFTGQEKLTDLTDQELFFEVPMTELLSKHNAVRTLTLDKKQTEKFGREIHLQPARIRDLKMVVVTVAQF